MQIKTIIRRLVQDHSKEIDAWFEEAYQGVDPLFYTSVDIRHSGVKIAPVDTNMFPAGFNNLSKEGILHASEVSKRYFTRRYPDTKKLLIIPEGHTRNLKYLDNILTLQEILTRAGFEVHVGNSDLTYTEPLILEAASGDEVQIVSLLRKDTHLVTKEGFDPDVIIVNNDFSTGTPEALEGISQVMIPPSGLGWNVRKKSKHFMQYQVVVEDFAKRFDLDPWLIAAEFTVCDTVNFKERTGIDDLAEKVDQLLTSIRSKYTQYHIKSYPYCFIKANQGTYGMGVMTAQSGEDVLRMNKKMRNKMAVIKGGRPNLEVLVQEAIPTIDRIDGYPAESMIYLIDAKPLGCMFRVNQHRTAKESLNVPGMHFVYSGVSCPVSGLIARLATLATVREYT